MIVIYRKGTKNNYVFVDSNNTPIKNKEILEYIGRLVIPPNYRDVKIFYVRAGHPKILYQGYDSKERLQRIYSSEWTSKASRMKFCGLLNFAEQIHNIAAQVKEDMMVDAHTKNKMISMIIRLVMVCYFRIGNKKYQELYGSFGAINIQSKHVIFKNNKGKESMYISFTGKKNILNSCTITDALLIKEIKKILKFRTPNEMIFQWNDGGVNVPIKATDVNLWLNNFDKTITSKAFRTYDANIFLIIFLRSQIIPSRLSYNNRNKIIIQAMKTISEKIHNTPAILKKNYTSGGIIDLYLKEPSKYERYFMSNNTPRQAFITYLRDYCKNFEAEKKEIIKEGGRAI